MTKPDLSATQRPVLQKPLALAPGLLLAAAIAVLAFALARLLPLPAVFYALILGMSGSAFASDQRLQPGLGRGAAIVLRTGVALLGLQISYRQVVSLGPGVFLLTVTGVVATLAAGLLAARMFALPKQLGAIAAVAVAICGASAAMAMAAALPKNEAKNQDAATTIAAITVIGTVAMLAYPALAALIGFPDRTAGIFLGATLHEVVQAVGAGYAVSDLAGETATIVKLVRVACLAPAVILVRLLVFPASRHLGDERPALIPLFLLGFLLLAVLASSGIVPREWQIGAAAVSRWCLLVAIAALGLRSSPGDMLRSGARPILAIAIASVFLALVIGGGLVMAGFR